jgi:cytochrome c-type biogenesis protein
MLKAAPVSPGRSMRSVRERQGVMDGTLFWSGSVIAATVAGVIALFAPCCISVMLPAYFAGSFQNRGLLAAMTFLFAAGVATVILPIAMGASLVRSLITTQHTALYAIGGGLMLAMAVYLLLGGQLHLPMPGHRGGTTAGPLSVYTLGVFSGIATACCAPVLAGVIALSGAASSFGMALGLGLAYVAGMVAPLFVISLLWERRDWRASRLYHLGSLTWRIGSLRRTISVSNLAGGGFLAAMAAWMLWAAFFTDGMTPTSGWQLRVSARLQHYGSIVTDALAWVPGWAAAVALSLLVLLAARRAMRQVGWIGADREEEIAGSAPR